MKKKPALPGVLQQDKPVMILDEPFNGLDPESFHIIRMLLVTLMAHDKTIIVISHMQEPITRLCDYIH